MNRRRGITAIDGAISLIAVLLIVQMWLLTATVEAHLAGHAEPILPAAIISGLIFAGCTGLFIFIHRIDAAVKSDERRN
jgi:hypothetical protein